MSLALSTNVYLLLFNVYRYFVLVAAVVLRLSKSWFRIGSLEILHYSKEYRLLREVVEFIIEDSFPWIGKKEDRFLVSH